MSMLSQALGFDRANNFRTDIDTSALEQQYASLNDPYANFDYYRRAMGDNRANLNTMLGVQAAQGGSSAIAQQQAQRMASQGGENVLNQLGAEYGRRQSQAVNVANQLANYDLQEIQLEDQKRQMQQSAAMEPFKLGVSAITGGVGASVLGGLSSGAKAIGGLMGNVGNIAGNIGGAVSNVASGIGNAFSQGFGSGMGAIGNTLASGIQGAGGLLQRAGQGIGNFVNQQQAVPQMGDAPAPQINYNAISPEQMAINAGGMMAPQQGGAIAPPPQMGPAPTFMGGGMNMGMLNRVVSAPAYSNFGMGRNSFGLATPPMLGRY